MKAVSVIKCYKMFSARITLSPRRDSTHVPTRVSTLKQFGLSQANNVNKLKTLIQILIISQATVEHLTISFRSNKH